MTEPQPSAFTRSRIASACLDALRRAGALGMLPTPLDAVREAIGVRERLDIATVPSLPPMRPELRARLLGAMWLEERVLFVDEAQSPGRRRFTEAHELSHLLCPWHAGVLRLDTADELFGELARGIEAEANYGAGQLLFQGPAFAREARRHERSLRTPFALAAGYGASRHAAAHHYVEGHPAPLALLVAGRWPGRDGCLPIWSSVESPSFLARFGRLRGCLPGGRLAARDGPDAPLAEAIEAARRSSAPSAGELLLADRGGRLRRCRAEVANNRHCHLVLVSA
jgi:IrrE N-terminal-like domain